MAAEPTQLKSLAYRLSGSLAVKALPAIYGVGLIVLVVRELPLGDFGRYGMAIAYMNLVSALSRGLWVIPFVIRAARGEADQALGPSFWLSLGTNLLGGLIGLIALPMLNVGMPLAVLTFVMLLVLVPRDLAMGYAQAEGKGKVRIAFLIEAGYFLGSLGGFVVLAALGLLRTAETAMLVNVAAAVASSLIGWLYRKNVLSFVRSGDWKGTFRLGLPIGWLAMWEVFLQQGDALIVGIFFSPEALAPYLAARTLLRMYGLLSQSVNFLVLPSASRLQASGQLDLLRQRLKTILKYMTVALVPINIAAFFLSPVLFPAFLGAKYEPAIPFFQALILVTWLEPFYSVLNAALQGVGKARVVSKVVLTALVFNAVSNFVLLWWTGKIWVAPTVLILTYALVAVAYVYISRREIQAA